MNILLNYVYANLVRLFSKEFQIKSNFDFLSRKQMDISRVVPKLKPFYKVGFENDFTAKTNRTGGDFMGF